MPGRPDLVLPKYKATVLVHGCFWHRHEGCRFATTPSTRAEFWQSKFEANLARDRKVREDLLVLGWRVATVWECALKGSANIERTADALSAWLRSDDRYAEFGELDL